MKDRDRREAGEMLPVRIGARDVSDQRSMRRRLRVEEQRQMRDVGLAGGRRDQCRERVLLAQLRYGVGVAGGEQRREIDAHGGAARATSMQPRTPSWAAPSSCRTR